MSTFRADIVSKDVKVRSKKRVWILSILAVLCIAAFVTFFKVKQYLFEGLPALPDKAAMWDMNVKPSFTLLDKDGNEIGHRGPYFGEILTLRDMPSYLPDAFLAIEDQRFFEHAGVDRKAILRALFSNIKEGETVQGGSTLTQQLVKNMVLTPEKTYKRKFQEMWLSYDMEQILTKPEILELYLNRISLGNRTFGVEAASKFYFGKSARDVNLSEAAMLAALPKAPSSYDPVRNYERALDRSKLVLRTMSNQGIISDGELVAAFENPAVIVDRAGPSLPESNIGYIFDHAVERAEGLVGHKAKDLIITTTIDASLQVAAQEAVTGVVTKNAEKKKVSEGALLSLDARSGAIRALVGGMDYTASNFNRVLQAKRQPGSAFKALVYAAALEEGFTPGTVRIDEPTDIAGWKPENYERNYKGPMTLREALKMSTNTIAAQVGAEIGPAKVISLSKRFGIQSELGLNYSLALGSSEVTLLDMVRAFSVFANEGRRRDPYLIESISDTSGEQLYQHKTERDSQVFAQPYARQMASMLRDVIQEGTGHGAKLGRRDAGGKTGTSQDYRDAWFVGFTSDYVTGVWMGNDDNSKMRGITGGLLPVDTWKKFMLAAHKGMPLKPLKAPEPEALDPELRRMMAFYSELSSAFLTERNMANGAGGGTTAGR